MNFLLLLLRYVAVIDYESRYDTISSQTDRLLLSSVTLPYREHLSSPWLSCIRLCALGLRVAAALYASVDRYLGRPHNTTLARVGLGSQLRRRRALLVCAVVALGTYKRS